MDGSKNKIKCYGYKEETDANHTQFITCRLPCVWVIPFHLRGNATEFIFEAICKETSEALMDGSKPDEPCNACCGEDQRENVVHILSVRALASMWEW